MLSLLFYFTQCRNITISKRGVKSDYQIVIPKTERGKQPWWYRAATEMRDGIRNITGETIEIITDNEEIANKAILIGPNKYSKAFTNLQFLDLDLDAYEIRFVKDEHLVINGGSRGNIYGVYELLERYAKFRFLSTWMEIFPEAEEFNVDSEVNMCDIAGFQYRHIWGTDTTLNFYHYVRKRANAGDEGLGYNTGGYKYSTFGTHSFWAQFPQAEYPTSKYPEMWALLSNGRRSKSAPCLTNPATFQVILGKIVAALQKDNASTYIKVGHNDNFDYCHCANCSHFMQKYGNRYSGVLLAFCNNLSIALRPTYPKHIIKMLAYYMTEDPPENIKGLDNIAIELAPLSNDIGHSINDTEVPNTVSFREKLINWTKVVKYVHLYEYHTNFNYPMNSWPNYHMIGDNIKYYGTLGIDGYFAEDNMMWLDNPRRIVQHADQTYFRQYVMSKMMFYPWRSVRYYEDEFIYGFYGGAAGSYVRKYFDVTKEWANKQRNVGVGCLAGPLSAFHTPNYNYYTLDLWRKAVDAARKEGNEKQIYNTEMAELGSCLTVYYMEKRKQWPLIVDSKGKVRMEGTHFEETTSKVLDRCHNVTYVDPYTKGICAITRFLERDGDWRGTKVYNEMKYYRDSVPAQIIKSGDLQAISGENPAFGRVFSFTKNGKEYINTTEGIDFTMSTSLRIIDHIDYDMKADAASKTETSMKFVANSDKEKVEKTYTMSSNGLQLNFKFTNNNAVSGIYRPTYSIPINLGDTTDIFFKLGNGNWERPTFDVVGTYVNHFGRPTKGQTTFSICSGKTKVGFKFDFVAAKTNFFSVKLDKKLPYITVYIGAEYVELAQNGVYENTISALPIENVGSLPSAAMQSLDTMDKIIHFYPLYYFGAKYKTWRPKTDDKSFLGISGFSPTHQPEHKGMLSFNPGQFLPDVFGLYGTDLNMSFRARCEDRNMSEQWPWWSGFTQNGKDRYQGSSKSDIPPDDVYFEIPLKPMYNATSSINVWLECTVVCKNFWVDGIKLVQNTTTSPYFGFPEDTYESNEEIEPMEEPDFFNYNENNGNSGNYNPENSNTKSNAGKIAGFTILAIVIIVAIVLAAFFLYKKFKKDEPSPSDRNEV